MSDTSKTTDHETIQSWALSHDGIPTVIEDTEDGPGQGVLRIHFPNNSSDYNFNEISWEQFFQQFEDNGLAFLYQDKEDSTFHKFVNR